MTADTAGHCVNQSHAEMRRLEKRFLKSEDQNNFTHSVTTTIRGGKPFTLTKKYPADFSDALRRWNADGRITALGHLESLFNDAQKLIKANKGSTEPNVRSVQLGREKVITRKAKSDAAYPVVTAEAFKDQISDDMKEVFGGTIPVKLFKAIDEGFDNAQLSFNLQITAPSNFHGFTIRSGAGNLADKLMKKYNTTTGQTNWGLFLTILRRYGVKEDICNTGDAQGAGLGDLNERKFIFYHEHFHKGGKSELEKVAQIKTKVYRD